MNDKIKNVGGPHKNEQDEPVYCSECGKESNSVSTEEGCICPATDTQKKQSEK